MQVLKSLRSSLLDPRMVNVDLDGPERIEVHRTILTQKKMMQGVFQEFYETCLSANKRHFRGEGRLVELGAGVSFFKEVCPELFVTDIVPGKGIEKVLDAQKMDIEPQSVRAFFGMNCFHHFDAPDKFFTEVRRVLIPGGGVVLIEPFYGPVAARFYQNLHEIEHFNPSQTAWETPAISGAATNANQALSYIVFVRDRALFEKRYPDLEIVELRPLRNYLRYLCSGGLNFRQLLPNFTIPLIKAAEWLAAPLARLLALHYVIVLRKR